MFKVELLNRLFNAIPQMKLLLQAQCRPFYNLTCPEKSVKSAKSLSTMKYNFKVI